MGPQDDDMPPIEDAEIVREEPRAIIATDRQATALAASVRATIQARVYLALERPRNLAVVKDRITSMLKRPSIAEKAVYRVQRGGEMKNGKWEPNYVEGPSIRLMEMMRQAFGNMDTTDMVIADSDHDRTIQVTALDYEANASESRQIMVPKTIERKATYDKETRSYKPPDREILSVRKNSYGKDVYRCIATDAEVMEMQNSQASRARRNAIRALLPPDMVEDAVALAKVTMASKVAKQRADEITRLRGVFQKIGVNNEGMAEYLGHGLDDATHDDLVGLGMLATAIGEGSTTWKAAVKARAEARAAEAEAEADATPPAAAPASTTPNKGTEAARAAVERATGKGKGEPTP